MPILEVDGRIIGQSLAIARYVARECGLAGSSSIDTAVADSIAESTVEIRENHLIPWFFQKDPQKKVHTDVALYIAVFVDVNGGCDVMYVVVTSCVTSCLQEELRKKMVEETVPKYMAAFDKLLGDEDYMVGNEVLFASIVWGKCTIMHVCQQTCRFDIVLTNQC